MFAATTATPAVESTKKNGVAHSWILQVNTPLTRQHNSSSSGSTELKYNGTSVVPYIHSQLHSYQIRVNDFEAKRQLLPSDLRIRRADLRDKEEDVGNKVRRGKPTSEDIAKKKAKTFNEPRTFEQPATTLGWRERTDSDNDAQLERLAAGLAKGCGWARSWETQERGVPPFFAVVITKRRGRIECQKKVNTRTTVTAIRRSESQYSHAVLHWTENNPYPPPISFTDNNAT